MIRRASVSVLACSALLLSACGSGATDSGASGGGGGKGVNVVVGFYPLEYATARIGGDRVSVTNLTKPGGHAHDVELSPQNVATVAEADLAVYEKTIQPAVDEAVTSQNVKHHLDVGQAAQLDAVVDQPIIDVADPEAAKEHEHGDGHDHEHEQPAPGASAPATEEPGHEGHGHEGHDHGAEAGTVDPHFWLDPVRYGKVATAIAQQLSQIDPEGKATYEKNLQAFEGDLKSLDESYRTTLSNCTSKTLVTSHAAFGYLAGRYGFEQAAISGLSPEQEPDAGRLAKVADYAEKHRVTAIYAETLGNPAIAETVARETGAKPMVLDPIEGLAKEGTDYLSIMRTNLETLKAGQGCS
ncbi:metal ABC transporter substrate-binding protein [Mobilicoccus caccae]|uniref:Zinc ABC transporter substrate-binding protein n=1 Tax=Mobilicoccus caccae TaxID=1859295 RepID=A0ABQ6IQ86_9MICO|nr:metal ABC transporter substrate-binding protein [Mobilicoccus caccae]GMA40060.1 zinc ABC transporter substrate-binding protein [Mobilicoccus caccae]